jgi:hypothetical protein
MLNNAGISGALTPVPFSSLDLANFDRHYRLMHTLLVDADIIG